ncbi:hypothetical protein [Terracidiphilus sp.]|uniref:hypothetical protein n=1 Tax=Terracidiphilus sp. TaxID=1964191 RepID=UPI003C21365C
MQSYSQDLRERVLWALDRGERPSSVARRLEVSRVWVYQVRARARKLGKRTSFQIGGHRRSRVAEMESVLRAWIEAEPGLALSELSARLAQAGCFNQARGAVASVESMESHLQKNLHASDQEREDVPQARRKWVEALPRRDVEKDRIH